MQKLLMLKGLPCTGKTEWAKTWVAQDPRRRVIVSRDNIRKMLGVPIFTDRRERLVSSIESEGVRKALKAGYDVVIDAYNLNPKVEAKWEKLVHSLAKTKAIKLEVIPFIRPVKDCIISDKVRPGDESVGAKLIWNLYEKFLKPQEDVRKEVPKLKGLEKLPEDYIIPHDSQAALDKAEEELTEDDMSW